MPFLIVGQSLNFSHLVILINCGAVCVWQVYLIYRLDEELSGFLMFYVHTSWMPVSCSDQLLAFIENVLSMAKKNANAS